MKIRTHLIILLIAVLCTSCASLREAQNARRIRSELNDIVIHGVDFRWADLHDIVEFINSGVARGSSAQSPTVVLMLQHNRKALPVTLFMKSASALAVVEAVAELTDSKVYARGNHLFIEPMNPELIPETNPLEDPFDGKKEKSNNEIQATR